MSKIKKWILHIALMVLFLKGAILLISYQQTYVFSIFAGVTSFFILKIIHSSHFELVFIKRRYALSLIRFIYLPLIPMKKLFGQKRGEILFALFLPSIICCLTKYFEGVLFSIVGVGLFFLLNKKKHPKINKA